MRKVVSSKQILASTALAAALAVFGCTSNKMPGDGQPSSMPLNSPATAAPTNGTSGGARPGTSGGITPMISSGPASMTTPGVDAYAVVAEAQGFRGRILGPSNPGPQELSASMQPTGQFQNPAVIVNPEITVNRSSSSEATSAVINDSGAGITIVNGGTTAAATVAGTGTPTAASAASASPTQVVTGIPTPTQSSVGVPSPTMTVSPATIAQSSATTPARTTTPATVTAPSTTQTRAIGSVTVPGAASLPTMISSSSSSGSLASAATIRPITATVGPNRTRAVRLTTTSNGTPMITNAR